MQVITGVIQAVSSIHTELDGHPGVRRIWAELGTILGARVLGGLRVSRHVGANNVGKHSRGRPDDGLQGWEGSCERDLSGSA